MGSVHGDDGIIMQTEHHYTRVIKKAEGWVDEEGGGVDAETDVARHKSVKEGRGGEGGVAAPPPQKKKKDKNTCTYHSLPQI